MDAATLAQMKQLELELSTQAKDLFYKEYHILYGCEWLAWASMRIDRDLGIYKDRIASGGLSCVVR